jgi:hypothetical protein
VNLGKHCLGDLPGLVGAKRFDRTKRDPSLFTPNPILDDPCPLAPRAHTQAESSQRIVEDDYL